MASDPQELFRRAQTRAAQRFQGILAAVPRAPAQDEYRGAFDDLDPGIQAPAVPVEPEGSGFLGSLNRTSKIFENNVYSIAAGGDRLIETGLREAGGPQGLVDFFRSDAEKAEAIANRQLPGRVSWDDVKADPWRAPQFMFEEGVGSLPHMGAAIYAPIPYAATLVGSFGQNRALNEGRDVAEGWDMVKAAPAAAATMALERIGGMGILNGGRRGILGATGAAAREAGTEYSQTFTQHAGERLGTARGADWWQAHDEGLGAALVGAGVGGTLHPLLTRNRGEQAPAGPGLPPPAAPGPFDDLDGGGPGMRDAGWMSRGPGLPPPMPAPEVEPIYQLGGPTRQLPAPARQLPAPGAGGQGGNDIEGYLQATRGAESGGDDRAQNKRSSADGRYQFLDSTWAAYHRRIYGGDGLNDKFNPEKQERLMRAFTEDNAAYLRRNNMPVDKGTLYAAHHFGPQGAVNMASNPNAPVAANVVAANPQYKGMTNGQALEWARNHVNGQRGGSGGTAPATSQAEFVTSPDYQVQLSDPNSGLSDPMAGIPAAPNFDQPGAYPTDPGQGPTPIPGIEPYVAPAPAPAPEPAPAPPPAPVENGPDFDNMKRANVTLMERRQQRFAPQLAERSALIQAIARGGGQNADLPDQERRLAALETTLSNAGVPMAPAVGMVPPTPAPVTPPANLPAPGPEAAAGTGAFDDLDGTDGPMVDIPAVSEISETAAAPSQVTETVTPAVASPVASAERMEMEAVANAKEPPKPANFLDYLRGQMEAESQEKGVRTRIAAEDLIDMGVPAELLYMPERRNPKTGMVPKYRTVKAHLTGVVGTRKGPLRGRGKQTVFSSLDMDNIDVEAFGQEGQVDAITPEQIGELTRAALEGDDIALNKNDPRYGPYMEWQERMRDAQEAMDRYDETQNWDDVDVDAINSVLDQAVVAADNPAIDPFDPRFWDDADAATEIPAQSAEQRGEEIDFFDFDASEPGDGGTGRESGGSNVVQFDAFGPGSGDTGSARQSAAAQPERLKGKVGQKAPGSDGGLFDTQDKTIDMISALDDVYAQGGEKGERAAKLQDKLMAEESAREAAQRAKGPKNDNTPETEQERLNRLAIEAEDAYNDFVGWGRNGTPDTMPPPSQRKAYNAWMDRNNELWEAKEAAAAAANGTPTVDEKVAASRSKELAKLEKQFDRYEETLGGLDADGEKAPVRAFAKRLEKQGVIDAQDVAEVSRILADKGMDAEDGISELRSILDAALDTARALLMDEKGAFRPGAFGKKQTPEFDKDNADRVREEATGGRLDRVVDFAKRLANDEKGAFNPDVFTNLFMDKGSRDGLRAAINKLRGRSAQASLHSAMDAAQRGASTASRPFQSWYSSGDRTLRAMAHRLESPTIARIADLFHAEAGKAKGTKRTYHQAVEFHATRWTRELGEHLEGLNDGQLRRVRDMLTGQSRSGASQAEIDATDKIRDLLKRIHAYRTAAGEDLGNVPDYFQRVIDPKKVVRNEADFLTKAEQLYRNVGHPDPVAAAKAFYSKLLNESAGIDGSLLNVARAKSPGTTSGKERKFGAEADRLLSSYYETDPHTVLSSYIVGSAKRAEFNRRFGHRGVVNSQERAIWLRQFGGKTQLEVREQRIQKEVAAWVAKTGEKADTQDVMRRVNDILEANLGILGNASAGTRTFVSTMHTWNQVGKMDRSLLTSMPEIAMGFVRTGNIAHGARMVKDTVVEFGRALAKMPPSEARRYAEHYGIVSNAMNDQVLQSRISAQQQGKFASKLTANFYRAIGLHQWTEATRIAAAKMSGAVLQAYAGDLASGNPRVVNRAKKGLLELGVTDHAGFAAWVQGQGRVVDLGQIDADTGFAAEWTTAVNRMVSQTIMNPTRAEKPVWANNPLGSLAFGLMSFSFSFKKNVVDRLYQTTKGAVKDRDIMQALPLLVGLPFLLAAVDLNDTYIRPALFGSSYNFEKESTPVHLLRVADRAGLAGAFSPLIQTVFGTKYNRTLSEALMGSSLGSVLQAADAGLALGKDSNSVNTNSAERKAAGALYDMIVEPAIDAASVFGGGKLAGAVVYGTGNREGGVLWNDREMFIGALAGPESEKSRKRRLGAAAGDPTATDAEKPDSNPFAPSGKAANPFAPAD